MIKSLKVLLIIWAATGILSGLAMIFIPEQLGAMQGYEMAMLGICLIVPSAFLIVAMTRDLLRNILWVQFAIAWAILAVAIGVYSILMGFVTFEQAGMSIIIDGAFAVAFLALYPYRAARGAARRRK